jgi:hypothetical protein
VRPQAAPRLTPGFAFLALGSGDNPTFKSVFTSLVPPEKDSRLLRSGCTDIRPSSCRAGYGMERSEAVVPVAPGRTVRATGGDWQAGDVVPSCGGEFDRGTWLTVQACCAVGAVLLAPLVFVGRDAPR